MSFRLPEAALKPSVLTVPLWLPFDEPVAGIRIRHRFCDNSATLSSISSLPAIRQRRAIGAGPRLTLRSWRSMTGHVPSDGRAARSAGVADGSRHAPSRPINLPATGGPGRAAAAARPTELRLMPAGVAYTSSCTPCKAGTHSHSAQDHCRRCPADTHSQRGASECQPCNKKTEYAPRGSPSCFKRQPCSSADYYELHSPCVQNKVRGSWPVCAFVCAWERGN